jgi:TolB-like protein/Tfp pilus assembly protein PilF
VTTNGMPKLLDFGIAKLLDPESTLYTREPTLLARAMTPEYSSPEQIRGETLTASSDLYSLGVLFYELVAGRPPYQLEGRSLKDVERIVCEELPPPPSTVTNVGDGHPRSKRRAMRRRLAGDLDTIALTALNKEPALRYASAHALADDIQRHLDGRSILASRLRLRVPRAWLRAFGAAAMLVIAAIVVVDAIRGLDSGGVIEAQSVAVLPFANVGENPELEYLSEGLTEDIINRLSRVPELKVIARDSAFRYKGLAVDPEQIGRELRVRSILAGRVVQRGSSLTVTAELVDTRDRRQIWGERYDRPAAAVQDLQSELAQQIAASLELELPRRTAISQTYTPDASAYEAYLKGRFFWSKRTVEAFRTSIIYYTQAVEKDPDFALAYVGLADSYGLLTEYHAVPATETYRQAKNAVLKALEIDPDLPEAHISLAYVYQFYEWNFEAAEREYRTVLARNPNYATGHQWYAEYLAAMGRHAEAVAEIRRALAVDPLSLIVNAVEANILYMGGEYEQALVKTRDVIAMDANFPEVYEYMKRSYDRTRQYREAIDARQTRRRLLGLDARETPALAEAAAATDPRVYWEKRLEQELDESEIEGFQPYEFAEIYAQAGDTARALEWLERACGDHDFMMMYVRVAPNLAPLRDEPKYRDIVTRGCAVME